MTTSLAERAALRAACDDLWPDTVPQLPERSTYDVRRDAMQRLFARVLASPDLAPHVTPLIDRAQMHARVALGWLDAERLRADAFALALDGAGLPLPEVRDSDFGDWLEESTK